MAAGEKGLVMAVFALPSLNLVFKVIRDRFGHPKTTTRDVVRAKYHLVFVHDRVGRLADAQEFEHLEFDRGPLRPGGAGRAHSPRRPNRSGSKASGSSSGTSTPSAG